MRTRPKVDAAEQRGRVATQERPVGRDDFGDCYCSDHAA